ncbi:MAG TPA: hypothetical protein VMT17_16820 [Anaeromyxobacteraceae bacterium]|nr:hypothetical protein [Anaeromyxobacteraceae bacterium]
MAEAKSARSAAKVQELIRDSIEAAQARLESLEDDAQKLIHDLSARVQKVSRKDLRELRGQVEKLRKAGLEAAGEWRDRAQTFRADAVERLLELQVRTMKFLGVATREEVEELSKEINKILRRLDEVQKRRARRPARKAPLAQA